MISLPDEIMRPLKRVNRVYFTDPDRILAVPAGEVLVRQDEECHRLYLVLRGIFVAYRRTDNFEGSHLPDETQVRGQEVFRAEPRSYVCVQSFFSRSYHSSYHIVALEDAEVAYIDDATQAVEPEKYGSLQRQFIPVLVHELAARNSRIFTHVSEKEEAVRLLQRAEMASTLGQLSAGIATNSTTLSASSHGAPISWRTTSLTTSMRTSRRTRNSSGSATRTIASSRRLTYGRRPVNLSGS